MPTFAVILPAAGKSSRFGGKEKKPFATLDGTAVWLRAANLFANRPDVVQMVLVISPDDRELVQRRYAANLMFLGVKVVDGGAERFESVANALPHLKPEAEFVAVHDAVCRAPRRPTSTRCSPPRPGTGRRSWASPSRIRSSADNQMRVTQTVPRIGLWHLQTPQVFRKDWLVEAYAKCAARARTSRTTRNWSRRPVTRSAWSPARHST